MTNSYRTPSVNDDLIGVKVTAPDGSEWEVIRADADWAYVLIDGYDPARAKVPRGSTYWEGEAKSPGLIRALAVRLTPSELG